MPKWTTLDKNFAEDSLVGLSIDEVAGGGLNLRQPPFLLYARGRATIKSIASNRILLSK
jgi:hypothetical protein